MRIMRTCLLLLILAAAFPAAAQRAEFTFRPAKETVEVLLRGKPFTVLHYEEKWDKPFLYPLQLPSGLVLSRAHPLEQRAGESTDHIWHRGIWWGHGDINGVDFWREKDRDSTGWIAVRKPPEIDRKKAGIRASCDLMTPKKEALGTLRLEFAFASKHDAAMIDVLVGIHADRGMPLKAGDTEECCLGIRWRDEFRQDRGATLLNSDGLVTTEKIWGKKAKWIDYSTAVDGKKAGIAVFDHPGNPRHPTWWHARGYAFAAANPFGERDFTKDKSRDGSMTVPAGGKLDFRYRIVLHSGDAAAANIEGLYGQFH